MQDLDTKKYSIISMDNDVGTIMAGMNQEYDTKKLNFNFQSPFIYQQQYEYDHVTKTKRKVQEVKLAGKPSINREDFVCEQIMVPGHDGEQIPLNLFFKKGTVKMNRRNRVLLEGYGAYGIPMSQGFDLIKVGAMERGWVIA